MPKISREGVITLANTIMITMSYLTCVEGQGDGYFSEHAIRKILSGQWTKYRKETLKGLVAEGMLERRLFYPYDEPFYRLTDLAKILLEKKHKISKWDMVKISDATQEELI